MMTLKGLIRMTVVASRLRVAQQADLVERVEQMGTSLVMRNKVSKQVVSV
jgi:hypothetical protein